VLPAAPKVHIWLPGALCARSARRADAQHRQTTRRERARWSGGDTKRSDEQAQRREGRARAPAKRQQLPANEPPAQMSAPASPPTTTPKIYAHTHTSAPSMNIGARYHSVSILLECTRGGACSHTQEGPGGRRFTYASSVSL
jgi:hypothetical protein